MIECNELESLTEAELACANKLKDLLGETVYLSHNPGLADCCVFDIGGLHTGDLTLFPSRTYHFRGQLDIYRRDRKRLQEFIMKLLLALPISADLKKDDDLRETSNVVLFRLAPESTAISGITITDVETTTNNNATPCYTVSAQFDVVFASRF